MPTCETALDALAAIGGPMEFHLAGTSAVAELEAKLREFYGSVMPRAGAVTGVTAN